MFGVIWWTSRPTPPTARPAIDAPRPARGGTLTGSLRSEPRSFNRLVARDFATELVATLTQAKLVRVNRATFELEPWLAERWSSSPDGLVHTFTLREGLQWSDGAPFTSADVAFTFQAIADPRTKSVLASNLEIDGDPVTVTTPDARTAVVTFPLDANGDASGPGALTPLPGRGAFPAGLHTHFRCMRDDVFAAALAAELDRLLA